MNIEKVLDELRQRMADPLQYQIATATLDRIEDKTPTGRLIISLLEKAENGDFK